MVSALVPGLIATAGVIEMHKRGIRILPGGDYGFAPAAQLACNAGLSEELIVFP